MATAAGPDLPPTAGMLRSLRGVVVGGSATCLAWAAHVAAGGSSPSPTCLTLLTLAAVAAGVAASARRWTLPALLGILLAAQLALHVLFEVAPTAAASHPVATGAMHGMHGMHGMGGVPSDAGRPVWLMPALHLVAGLLTALLLRRGEHWCWQVLLLLVAPMRRVGTTGGLPRWTDGDRGTLWVGPIEVLVLLPGSHARRGPPLVRVV